MNLGGNAAFDQAEQRAEQEREAKIAEASRSLLGAGSIQCENCPVEIPLERRVAIPSATRCINCQTQLERMRK